MTNPPVLLWATYNWDDRAGDRSREQDRLGLHPEPADRQAADRDQREEGAAESAGSRVQALPDPALPGRPAVRQPVLDAQGVAEPRAYGKPFKVGCIFQPYESLDQGQLPRLGSE